MAAMDLTGQLEGLFREVGEAHHQAYIETDGADPEWSLWYAEYLRGRLDASFTKSEIVYLLLRVANEQPLNAPGANWARCYARFFINFYTKPSRGKVRASGCNRSPGEAGNLCPRRKISGRCRISYPPHPKR